MKDRQDSSLENPLRAIATPGLAGSLIGSGLRHFTGSLDVTRRFGLITRLTPDERPGAHDDGQQDSRDAERNAKWRLPFLAEL